MQFETRYNNNICNIVCLVLRGIVSIEKTSMSAYCDQKHTLKAPFNHKAADSPEVLLNTKKNAIPVMYLLKKK